MYFMSSINNKYPVIHTTLNPTKILKPAENHNAIKMIIVEWSGPLLVAIVYLLLTIRYWRRWGDIIIDYGREVYIAWQISTGKVLYRDIDYMNGPLAPYLNALWFKISGVSITTLFIYNICISAILTIILYKLIKVICDRTTATLSCLMFLLLFAFSFSPIYNFISPYDHDLIYGFFFAVLMIYYLFSYQYRSKIIKISCAGFCLGLVFLTKAEVFLATIITAILSITIDQKVIKLKAHSLHQIIIVFLVSMIVPILMFGAYFSFKMPLDQVIRGVSSNWHFILNSNILNIPYYNIIMGFDAPLKNILFMLITFVLMVLMLVGGLIIEFINNGVLIKHNRFILTGFVIIMMLYLALIYITTKELIDFNQLIGRPLPLLILLMLSISIFYYFISLTNEADKLISVQLITWFTFGFLLLNKVILRSTLRSYGFVLAIPAMLILTISIVWLIPRLLTIFYGKCYFFRKLSIFGLIIFLLSIVIYNDNYYFRKDHLIGKGLDSFLVYDLYGYEGTAKRFNQVVEYIDNYIPAKSTLLVLPEGVMINYLTRHQAPISLTAFTPGEYGAFGETYIINLLTKHPPDFIILVNHPFWLQVFGTDWGKKTMNWIKEHYTIERLFDNTPKTGQFGDMKLLKLNSYLPDHGKTQQ